MVAKKIDVSRVQPQFSELLSQMQAGTEIIITHGGEAIGRLVPITPSTVVGSPATPWAGISFDEPLPDDFWTRYSANAI